jgi:chloramphenicol 3-O-phosphotransferase
VSHSGHSSRAAPSRRVILVTITRVRGRYVVVTGPPPSGKSTLARALAALLDLPLLVREVGRAGHAVVDTNRPVDVPDVAERVRRTRSRR